MQPGPLLTDLQPAKNTSARAIRRPQGGAFGWALVYVLALAIAFFWPLLDWVQFASQSDLYSHTLLIPFISGYLIWLKWKKLSLANMIHFSWVAAVPGVSGIASLALYWFRVRPGEVGMNDYLSLTMFAFVSFLLAGGILFLGNQAMRELLFPSLLLFFIAPFPECFLNWLETFLQHGSAEAANMLLAISGTPYFRQGLVFQLPSLPIEVARECSGIHSSLVLFITSLIAGYLFLRNPWRRSILASSVIPLGILRNGFRIFTISLLCVYRDPQWIDSNLHRKGGPLFFLLSLVPFFLLLHWMRRMERKNPKNGS